MKPLVTIRKALDDPALLGGILPGDTWRAWRVLLTATMGEKLTTPERAIYKTFTGRDKEPPSRVDEAAFVVGRRGGKSRSMSTLATYIAGLCDHSDKLVPGERGVLLCIAPDQRQAAITLNYTAAAFERSKMLRQLIEDRTADTLRLKNGIDIEVRAASFRRLRGPTFIAVLADEAAFWFSSDTGSANADTEILNAVRPGLATTGGPLIIGSSPYARRGELWSLYKANYGPDGDPRIIVAQGASRDFNPSLSEAVVSRAYARDPIAASAEYGGQFRADIESLLTREAVESVVSPGVYERPFLSGRVYVAFCDPAGGSGKDSMTLAIGHREGEGIIVDAIRERRPPFSPEQVVAEFCALLKSYRVAKVTGDRFAGEWPREAFRKHGVAYDPAAEPKSNLYRDLLPAINSKLLDLLDHDKLINQLVSLERKTARGGRESIDHPPNGHDDVANAVAGLDSVLSKKHLSYDDTLSWVDSKSMTERHASIEAFMKATAPKSAALRGGAIIMER
ncbi:hypothetical protein [Pseudorhodoplanes sp.]|uniref:hypothetical protein n=1 Tax=Pseudorhodoplanes sp. TaxID=1934341 RepID=UPI003D0C2895